MWWTSAGLNFELCHIFLIEQNCTCNWSNITQTVMNEVIFLGGKRQSRIDRKIFFQANDGSADK
jgi:hypothetical protein